MSAALGLLAVLVLTVGTGYFVAQEFAYVAADRVPAGAGLDTILFQATAADRSRLLVLDGRTVLGSVHSRDALVARSRGRNVTARELARPVPELNTGDSVSYAVEQLRRRRASLAVIRDEEGRLTGLISLDDLIARLMGLQAA